jgi:hypothetical protein
MAPPTGAPVHAVASTSGAPASETVPPAAGGTGGSGTIGPVMPVLTDTDSDEAEWEFALEIALAHPVTRPELLRSALAHPGKWTSDASKARWLTYTYISPKVRPDLKPVLAEAMRLLIPVASAPGGAVGDTAERDVDLAGLLEQLNTAITDRQTDPDVLKIVLTAEGIWGSDPEAIQWLTDAQGNPDVRPELRPVLREALEFRTGRASAPEPLSDTAAPSAKDSADVRPPAVERLARYADAMEADGSMREAISARRSVALSEFGRSIPPRLVDLDEKTANYVEDPTDSQGRPPLSGGHFHNLWGRDEHGSVAVLMEIYRARNETYTASEAFVHQWSVADELFKVENLTASKIDRQAEAMLRKQTLRERVPGRLPDSIFQQNISGPEAKKALGSVLPEDQNAAEFMAGDGVYTQVLNTVNGKSTRNIVSTFNEIKGLAGDAAFHIAGGGIKRDVNGNFHLRFDVTRVGTGTTGTDDVLPGRASEAVDPVTPADPSRVTQPEGRAASGDVVDDSAAPGVVQVDPRAVQERAGVSRQEPAVPAAVAHRAPEPVTVRWRVEPGDSGKLEASRWLHKARHEFAIGDRVIAGDVDAWVNRHGPNVGGLVDDDFRRWVESELPDFAAKWMRQGGTGSLVDHLLTPVVRVPHGLRWHAPTDVQEFGLIRSPRGSDWPALAAHLISLRASVATREHVMGQLNHGEVKVTHKNQAPEHVRISWERVLSAGRREVLTLLRAGAAPTERPPSENGAGAVTNDALLPVLIGSDAGLSMLHELGLIDLKGTSGSIFRLKGRHIALDGADALKAAYNHIRFLLWSEWRGIHELMPRSVSENPAGSQAPPVSMPHDQRLDSEATTSARGAGGHGGRGERIIVAMAGGGLDDLSRWTTTLEAAITGKGTTPEWLREMLARDNWRSDPDAIEWLAGAQENPEVQEELRPVLQEELRSVLQDLLASQATTAPREAEGHGESGGVTPVFPGADFGSATLLEQLDTAIIHPRTTPEMLGQVLAAALTDPDTTRDTWGSDSDAIEWLTAARNNPDAKKKLKPILGDALKSLPSTAAADVRTKDDSSRTLFPPNSFNSTGGIFGVADPPPSKSGQVRLRPKAYLDEFPRSPQPEAVGRSEETRTTASTDGSETRVPVGATGERSVAVAIGLPPLAWEDVLRARSWKQEIDPNGVIKPDPGTLVPSKAQIGWATGQGMTFFGKRDGGGFFDALAAAGRAAGLGERFENPETLLTKVVQGRADSPNAAIVKEYDVLVGGAHQTLADPVTWQKLFAGIEAGDRDAVVDGLLPALAHQYLSVPLRVVEPDGQVRSYGDGPGITLARVTQNQSISWSGLAPTRAPLFLGPQTRPADVAGGWSGSDSDEDPDAYVMSGPAVDAFAMGPLVPEEVSPAYRDALWRQRLRFAEVPRGTDAFFNAVLRAADGGFSVGGVFVDDVAHLRTLLVNEIDKAATAPDLVDDPDFWPVVYTAYKALYSQRQQQGHGSSGEDDTTARIMRGEALNDIRTSISDPGSWPELAEAVAPYFLVRLGVSVRVVSGAGLIGRYGTGRPVYVTPLADGGQGASRWAALPKATPRFAVGAPLGTPNMSDPVLVRLGQAADARRSVAGVNDPVFIRLDKSRTDWMENGAGRPVTATGDRWSSEDLTKMVASLQSVSADAGSSPHDGRTVGGGLGLASAVELTSSLFRERGGIRPAPTSGGAASAEAGRTGIQADQWMVVPSLRELIREVPSKGAAMFVSGERTWVAVHTTGGVELAEFGPEHPEGRVGLYSPPTTASANSAGLALFIGQNGQVVPGKPFAQAIGWDVDELSTATIDAAPHAAVPDAAPEPSRAQEKWARENGRQFTGLRPGDDSFFNAAIITSGGHLTVNGEKITDAVRLRQALAASVRERAAGPAGLGLGPFVPAAFIFTAEERIIEEFLGYRLSELHRREVYLQIAKHLQTGEAKKEFGEALEKPNQWEEMARLLVPALLAASAHVRLKVVEPDGRVRAYEADGGARDLVLARIGSHSAGSPAWAAVMPDSSESLADVGADETVQLAAAVPAGETALLSDLQTRVVAEERLTLVPTEHGPDSFFSAVLTAAGGGIMLDRRTYVDTASGLRRGLARLVRERPDVLESVAWQAADKEKWDSETIIRTLTDPAVHDIDELARLLIDPYLGVELRVVESHGEIRSRGRGRPLNIAPTKGANGSHWAAFVPDPGRSLQGASSPGLKGIFDEPSRKNPWSATTHKWIKPGAVEEPWRSASFCAVKDGVITCVSVAVFYRLPPSAERAQS